MITNPEIWWEQVTGPNRMIEDIVSTIAEKKSVILFVDHDLPWRHVMRSIIKSRLLDDDSIRDVYILDAEERCQNNRIEDCILDYLAKDQKNAYRSSVTIPAFIISKEYLKRSVLWIKGIPSSQHNDWLRFCREWLKIAAPEDGVIIIETTHFVDAAIKGSKKLEYFDATKYITTNDTLIFAALLASMKNESGKNDLHATQNHLQYIANVAASLCVTDAEVVASLVDKVDFTKDDPLEGLELIFRDGFASTPRGTAVRSNQAEHPFHLLREQKLIMLKHRLWEAQVKTIFPLIELERITIIKNYYNSIEKCEIRENQFGNNIDTPYDIELSQLKILGSQKGNHQGRKVHFSAADFRRIGLLKRLRDAIAHQDVCTPSDIDAICSGHSFSREQII